MTLWRRGSAIAGGLVALAALVAPSHLPLSDGEGDAGALRLSWRAAAVRVEACRPPTEDEIAALPVHMRPTEVCDRTLAPYRLEVSVDGARVVDREIRPSGFREDRPAFVFEELPLEPGAHAVEVRFSALVPDGVGTAPPPLQLEAPVRIAARRVVLVTRDAAGGGLVVRDRVSR